MSNLGQLNPDHFIKLLARYGEVPYSWEQYVGKCSLDHSGPVSGFETAYNCPLCHGTGVIYAKRDLPVSGRSEGKLLLSSAMVGRENSPIEIEDGDIVCSYLEDDYPFGEKDRLQLTSRESSFSEQIVRGAADRDLIRRPPATTILAVYSGAVEVTNTYDEFGAISSGFEVSSDGRYIVWTNGPVAGASYTVLYRYRPSYIILQGSHHHRVQTPDGRKFPSRVVLHLDQHADVDDKPELFS